MAAGELFAAIREEGDRYLAEVPNEWTQGRTSFGGYSAAMAYEVARRFGGELPPLRSAQIAFVGPLFGEVELTARVLRKGRNATWIAVEITSEKGVGLSATFVFMQALDSRYDFDRVAAPADMVPLDKARDLPDSPMRPQFTRNLDMKFARPKPGEPQAELCWYVRLKERVGLDPMTELLLIADSLPPGVLGLGPIAAPMSSMTWQINLLTDKPATDDGWFMLESRAEHARDGSSHQAMGVWDASGRPLAAQTQSFALFG